MRHVAIFGCPRSGTSWLGQILNSSPAVLYRYQPLFSYEFKDWFGRHGLSPTTIATFAEALAAAQSEFVLQDIRPLKQTSPSHLVWKEVRYHHLMPGLLQSGGLDALIYLFRSPVAVINSWYQAPKEFRAGQDIHVEWRHAPSKNIDAAEFNGFERWKESLRIALELARHEPRMLLVDYDVLRAAPMRTTRTLFDRLALAVEAATLAFLTASTSRHDPDPYSVFRAEGSPMALPQEIVDAMDAEEEANDLLAEARSLAVVPG